MVNVRIRMYRTGFGDCFLLSFGSPSAARHILVDFGAHMHGEIGTMEPIMDDIESETGKKLEVVIATHPHRDHISGFGKFATRFTDFTIGEVWLPWTDNPADTQAKKLQKKQLALYDRLDNHLRLALGATESDPRYASALHALSNLRGNQPATDALGRGFGTGTPRYFQAGDRVPKVGAITGLSAEILGPPRDQAFFSRMDPPADQRFLSAPGDMSGAVHPFPALELHRRDKVLKQLVRKSRQPEVPSEEIERLNEIAETPADRLALVLDNVRNNTSLVVVFRYRGKALLFPGDAQWGSWQSWIGTDDATRLIGELDFLKVAHHGSHNATPVAVVKALRASGLAAMISTQVKPYPTIPRKPLIVELEKHCGGHIAVRSDWIKCTGAPAGPKMPVKLPKGYKIGKLAVDYRL